IKRLGDQHSEQITDALIQLFDADRTKEIRAQILRALVEGRTQKGSAKVFEIARSGDDIALRQLAIRYLGDVRDPAALDELIRLQTSLSLFTTRSRIHRFVLLCCARLVTPKARMQ